MSLFTAGLGHWAFLYSLISSRNGGTKTIGCVPKEARGVRGGRCVWREERKREKREGGTGGGTTGICLLLNGWCLTVHDPEIVPVSIISWLISP